MEIFICARCKIKIEESFLLPFSEKVGCGLADVRCGDATECERPLGVSSCNDEQGQHDFRQFLQGEQLAELNAAAGRGK